MLNETEHGWFGSTELLNKLEDCIWAGERLT